MPLRLGIVVLVLGATWAVVPPAIAGCEGGTYPTDDPRVEYEHADIAGVGRVSTDANKHRIVDFDRVVKGDAPAEMDIGPKPTSCDPDAPNGTSGIFLTHDGGGWHLSSAPSDAVLAAADPLPHDGSGPAVLIERTASSRDPLVALDEQGRALASSPAGGLYEFVSVCPGDHSVIAWRTDGTSDRLSLPGLELLGPGPDASVAAPLMGRAFSARCTADDGSTALAVYIGKRAEVTAQLTLDGARTLLQGPFQAALSPIVDGSHILAQRGNQLRLIDVLTGKVRWRLRRSSLGDLPRIAPDGRHALLTLGSSDTPAVVDLRGTRPHAQLFKSKYFQRPEWVGSDRIVLGMPTSSGLADSPIVDLRGRVLGHYRGHVIADPVVVGGNWIYNLRFSIFLERAPRTGGTAGNIPLPLFTDDLQSLTL